MDAGQSGRLFESCRASWTRVLVTWSLVGSAGVLIVLLAALAVKALKSDGQGDAIVDFNKPAVGEAAPDFTLRDLDGQEYRLSGRTNQIPLVLEFGSVTCRLCDGASSRMEELAKKYAGKVEFVFVYCKESHPDTGVYLPGHEAEGLIFGQTASEEERAYRATAFCSAKKPTARTLVDAEGAESVERLYGSTNGNPTVVIDPDGRIALKQASTNTLDLEAFLERMLAAGGG